MVIFGKTRKEDYKNVKYFFRKYNIDEAEPGQAVAVSVNDGRIFYDGTLVQEQRYTTTYCTSVS